MIDMGKFIVIFNLHLVLVFSGSSNLIHGPSNMVAFVGQRMEMKCQTDSNSTIREWSFQKLFTSNEEIIFTNWKDISMVINSRFGVVSVVGGLLLYKNSTEMVDAGIYTCAVQRGRGQPNQYSAHLIVFETDPLCETNLTTSGNNIFEEGNNLWMRCAVNFTGSWVQTLEWRMYEVNAGIDEEPTDLTDLADDNEIVPNAGISSTLTIALAATTNASYYSCKIYFSSARNTSIVNANNTPNYSYIWKSPIVNVMPSTQGQVMTTDALVKNTNGMDSKTISVVVLSILFGAAIAAVGVIVIYTKGKKSPAELSTVNWHNQSPDNYMYLSSANDEYETIQEVTIDDGVAVACCSPTEDYMSPADYSPLTPTCTQSEVNSVYTGINVYEQPVGKETAVTDETLKVTK